MLMQKKDKDLQKLLVNGYGEMFNTILSEKIDRKSIREKVMAAILTVFILLFSIAWLYTHKKIELLSVDLQQNQYQLHQPLVIYKKIEGIDCETIPDSGELYVISDDGSEKKIIFEADSLERVLFLQDQFFSSYHLISVILSEDTKYKSKFVMETQ